MFEDENINIQTFAATNTFTYSIRGNEKRFYLNVKDTSHTLY